MSSIGINITSEDLAAAREEQTANKGPFFFKLPEEACSCT